MAKGESDARRYGRVRIEKDASGRVIDADLVVTGSDRVSWSTKADRARSGKAGR